MYEIKNLQGRAYMLREILAQCTRWSRSGGLGDVGTVPEDKNISVFPRFVRRSIRRRSYA